MKRYDFWMPDGSPHAGELSEDGAWVRYADVQPYKQMMKQAEREGVDAEGMIMSLMKKVEDQRRELAGLNEALENATVERNEANDR